MDYQLFKQAYFLFSNSEHLTPDGLKMLVAIKASMNRGLPDQLLTHFCITPITRPLIQNQEIKDPYWLAGFTSGEGCFFINIYKNASNTGYKTSLRFKLGQHKRDKIWLENIRSFFNCGIIAKYSRSNVLTFVVSSFSDIYEKIIPFFKEHPVLGIKSLYFYFWCLRSWRQK